MVTYNATVLLWLQVTEVELKYDKATQRMKGQL